MTEREQKMTRLILQHFNAGQEGPFDPSFPPIVEFCPRDTHGQHIFPERDAFFTAVKKGRKDMAGPQHTNADAYLDDFFAPESFGTQQLENLSSLVMAQLQRADAAPTDGKPKPIVEIVTPRKAVFDGNIGAIMLAEHVTARLTDISPEIDWRVAYDVLYQAPLTEADQKPLPRKHPGYAKQSQYMALSGFQDPDRTAFLVGIDDSTRYGRAARDLGLFAQQNNKTLLAFAVFQSYISTSLQPEQATQKAFETAFDSTEQRALNAALKPFGLNIGNLTDPEMAFFAGDPLLDNSNGRRIDTALSYLAEQEQALRFPVLLPKNDHFFRHIEAGKPLRFADIRPSTTQSAPTAKPAYRLGQR